MPILNSKAVCIVGATSGIGRALAERLGRAGQKTFITGRRQELLDEIAALYPGIIVGINLDPAKLEDIPAFAKKMVDEGVDFVILNFGLQRPSDFSKPTEVDLDVIANQMHVNYLAPVNFIKAFLSLVPSPQKFTIAATTSGLALAPLPRVPGYCSSKFALRSFLLAVRRQLEYEGDANGVKIVEILPPAVQTELHDPKVQPEFAGKPAFGVPLDEYAQDLYDRLVSGDQDEIAYGTSLMGLNSIGKLQRAACERMPVRM